MTPAGRLDPAIRLGKNGTALRFSAFGTVGATIARDILPIAKAGLPTAKGRDLPPAAIRLTLLLRGHCSMERIGHNDPRPCRHLSIAVPDAGGSLMATAIDQSVARQAAAPGSARGRGREVVHATLAAAHEAFHVPSAFVTDSTVYLTGVIAAWQPGEGRAQSFRAAFTQIGEVLAACGAGWDDVVKLTSFHIDIAADLRIMAGVKDEFCRKPYPAWSVIGAGSLANPDGICEIEVIAGLPSPR